MNIVTNEGINRTNEKHFMEPFVFVGQSLGNAGIKHEVITAIRRRQFSLSRNREQAKCN
jgi:hypothetical protein